MEVFIVIDAYHNSIKHVFNTKKRAQNYIKKNAPYPSDAIIVERVLQE